MMQVRVHLVISMRYLIRARQADKRLAFSPCLSTTTSTTWVTNSNRQCLPLQTRKKTRMLKSMSRLKVRKVIKKSANNLLPRTRLLTPSTLIKSPRVIIRVSQATKLSSTACRRRQYPQRRATSSLRCHKVSSALTKSAMKSVLSVMKPEGHSAQNSLK